MDSDDELPNILNTQLCDAVRDGSLDRCQALVQQLKSKILDSHSIAQHLTPALAAAVGSKRAPIASYLLEQGAIVSGNIMVLALGDTDDAIALFQTFLDHGWDINSKTDLGNIMLKHIVSNEKLTHWFLSHGANPNAYGSPGTTILDVAAANSTLAIFELLLSHGARLEASDALHSAMGEREKRPGRVEMAAYLLDLGLNINALGRRDYPPGRRIGRGTPLHAAVTSQQIDRIEFLLKRGADTRVRNTLGQTPLEYAVAKGFATSEALLRRAMMGDAETSIARPDSQL